MRTVREQRWPGLWVVLAAAAVAAAVSVAALAPATGGAAAGATDRAGGSVTAGVVTIDTRLGYSNAAAAGTGMVLSSAGDVLTNNHVIRGATAIRVTVPGSGRSYAARVLGYDISDDVAVLRLQHASGLQTVSLGDSSGIVVNQPVTAVGNAGGTGTLTTQSGTITGTGRTITVNDEQGGIVRLRGLLETDAGLEPGDSGGPLLDQDGNVIGIDTAASATFAFEGGSTDGYAIPINRAKTIAAQIRAGRPSASVHIGPTPFLGVGLDDTSDGSGGVVTAVASGSPAARTGLEPGDVIVSFDSHAVRTRAGLVALLLRKKPGAKAQLGWLDRLGQRETATITLASGPPQ